MLIDLDTKYGRYCVQFVYDLMLSLPKEKQTLIEVESSKYVVTVPAVDEILWSIAEIVTTSPYASNIDVLPRSEEAKKLFDTIMNEYIQDKILR